MYAGCCMIKTDIKICVIFKKIYIIKPNGTMNIKTMFTKL